MVVTVYGIPNCDTVKKARAWLEANEVAYVFHDFRKQGLEYVRLKSWVDELGRQVVLNRAGTTFRKLPEPSRDGLDGPKAIALMLDQPAMIKRPVLDTGSRRLVGFKPDNYAAVFA